jgi:hypothetical protein
MSGALVPEEVSVGSSGSVNSRFLLPTIVITLLPVNCAELGLYREGFIEDARDGRTLPKMGLFCPVNCIVGMANKPTLLGSITCGASLLYT